MRYNIENEVKEIASENEVKGKKQVKRNINVNEEIKSDIEELDVKHITGNLIKWILNNVTVDYDELTRTIWHYRGAQHKDTISMINIKNYLMAEDDIVRRNMLSSFIESIKYDTDAKDSFDELAKLISGKSYHKQYPIILRQVYWTIKRRLYGLSVYNPILLSFYGTAGKGKTQLLDAMFNLIPKDRIDIVKDGKVIFEDERHSQRLNHCFVVILNELAGLNNTNANSLKNIIDSPILSYRLLGGHGSVGVENNAQFIGTSNDHLRDVITSEFKNEIRKIAEIDIEELPDDKVDERVKAYKSFDWLSLWKCVDENGDSPFHNPIVYAEYKKWTADVCYTETSHTSFIETYKNENPGTWISLGGLFDLYKQSVKVNLNNRQHFNKKCEAAGLVKVKRKSWDWKIPASEEQMAKDKLMPGFRELTETF